MQQAKTFFLKKTPLSPFRPAASKIAACAAVFFLCGFFAPKINAQAMSSDSAVRPFSSLATPAGGLLGADQTGAAPQFAPMAPVRAPSPGEMPRAMTGPAAAMQAWSALPMDARAACSATPEGSLAVQETPALKINDTFTERELVSTAAARENPNGLPGGTDIELGFYDVTHRFSVNSPLVAFSTGAGYAVCIKRFNATMSSAAQIFIARELPPGSCPRKEIMDHELIHYKIDRDQVARLRQEVPQMAAQFTAVYWGATVEEARSRAEEANQQFSNLLQKRFYDLRTPPQHEHDNPAEYERLTRSCGGETQRIGMAASR